MQDCNLENVVPRYQQYKPHPGCGKKIGLKRRAGIGLARKISLKLCTKRSKSRATNPQLI